MSKPSDMGDEARARELLFALNHHATETTIRSVTKAFAAVRADALWIPCSERMPEPQTTVLALSRYDEPVVAAHWPRRGWSLAGHISGGEPAYWMPLPPPPTKGTPDDH